MQACQSMPQPCGCKGLTIWTRAKMALVGQLAGPDFFHKRGQRDTQKSFRFRWERIWVGSAWLEMEGKGDLKLCAKLGCSPQNTQIVPKWHLADQLAGPDFFHKRGWREAQKSVCFRRERIWVGSALLGNGGKSIFEILLPSAVHLEERLTVSQ